MVEQPFIRASIRVMERMDKARTQRIDSACLDTYRNYVAKGQKEEYGMTLIDLADALLEAHRRGQMREVAAIKYVLLLKGRGA